MRLFLFFLVSLALAAMNASAIGVSPSRLDYGTVAPGSSSERSLTVFNTGKDSVVYHISVDDGAAWFSAIPASLSLLPGEHTELKVTLTLPEDSELVEGSYERTLLISQEVARGERLSLAPGIGITASFVMGKPEGLSGSPSLLASGLNNGRGLDPDAAAAPEGDSQKQQGILGLVHWPETGTSAMGSPLGANGIIISSLVVLIGMVLYSFSRRHGLGRAAA